MKRKSIKKHAILSILLILTLAFPVSVMAHEAIAVNPTSQTITLDQLANWDVWVYGNPGTYYTLEIYWGDGNKSSLCNLVDNTYRNVKHRFFEQKTFRQNWHLHPQKVYNNCWDLLPAVASTSTTVTVQ